MMRPRFLPLVFACGLVEDVFLAADGEDSVLQSALPTRMLATRPKLLAFHVYHLPLVLHALNLVIHAEHDVAKGVVIIVVVIVVILRIVEVGVDSILIIFLLDAIIRAVNLGGSGALSRLT